MGGDGNRGDQVGDWGTEGESMRRNDLNRGQCENPVQWNLDPMRVILARTPSNGRYGVSTGHFCS